MYQITGGFCNRAEERFKSRNPYIGNIEYGDIRGFADFTRFQIRSAYKIAALIFPGQMLDDQAIDNLLRQLEVGIPEEALFLLDLPLTMTREEYLAIVKSGISNKEQFYSAHVALLKQILEPVTVERIVHLKSNQA